jgi:hypothetical protein
VLFAQQREKANETALAGQTAPPSPFSNSLSAENEAIDSAHLKRSEPERKMTA